jgi:phosphate transport system permease protein
MISTVRYMQRRMTNYIGLGVSCLAMAFGLFFLGAILWTLISRGLPAINLKVFTEMTPPPGASGGLLNAICGSLWMTALGTLIGTPIGILAATYLAEFSTSGDMGSVIRFINGILLSAPSVVIGFFIYTLFVLRMGHFSGWAGVFALSTIIIPVVVNNTENMLRLVPNSLREAAAALGAPQWKITVFIVYKAAKAGILTGVLLAIARISGETAPLLFTALNNQFWSWDLARPLANLPVVIFQFAMSPYEDWQHLAWAGALLITLAVLIINVVARILVRKTAAN